jgi:hypothetical protein
MASLGLIGIVLMVLLRAGGSAPEVPVIVPSADSVSVQLTRSRTRGAELLREYFHGSIPAGVVPDIIIATVPDPYDSHLDQQYDQFVESLRRAYEAAGYVLDRFFLPGRDETATDKIASSPDSVTRPARELKPGVILFRGTGPKRGQVALLYLVGEIPTGGIHKDALRAALAERDELLAASDTTPLRVIGPTFSGSALSLRMILQQWLTGNRRASVLTGTATSPANAEILRFDPRVSFAATINDDATLQLALIKMIKERLDLDRIAFLHESTTSYGSGIGGVVHETGRSTEEHNVLLSVPFPLNISSVRAEFARNPQQREQQSSSGPALPARKGDRLPLQLQDAARPKEAPSVVSALTPPTLELILEQIMQTLRSHEVEAVGLLATDVRDKLFLGELVREQLPDVQLFTFESNSLYLRRDYGRSLGGMIVISTYPLWPENQKWSQPAGKPDDHQVVLFASDGAQGVYNAAALFLGAPRIEYEPASIEQSPLAGNGPPVWITAVGNRSFVPLAMCGVQRAGGAGTIPYLASSNPDRVQQDSIGRVVVDSVECTGFSAIRAKAEDVHGMSFLGWLLGVVLSFVLAWGSINYLLWQRTDRSRPKRRIVLELPHRKDIEQVSLWTHAHLYAALRLIALVSMFVPVLITVLNSGGRFTTHSMLETLPAIAAVMITVFLVYSFVVERLRGRTAVTLLIVPALLLLSGLLLHRSHPGELLWESMVLWSFTILLLGLWLLAFLVAVRSVYSYAVSHATSLRRYVFPDLDKVVEAHADTVPPGAENLRALRKSIRWRRASWLFETVARGGVAVFGVTYGVLTIIFVAAILSLGGPNDLRFIQFFHRSVELDNGLSPLLPVVLAGMGFAAWSSWHLTRVELLLSSTAFEQSMTHQRGTWLGKTPANRLVASTAERLSEYVYDVRNRLFFLVPNRIGALVLFLLATLLVWLALQMQPTIERVAFQLPNGLRIRSFDWLLRAAILATFGATAWAIYRLVSLWRGLGAVLNAIADTPLFSAFERLPRRLSGFSRPSLVPKPSLRAVSATAELQWQHLRKIYHNCKWSEQPADVAVAPAEFHSLMDHERSWTETDERTIKAMGEDLGKLQAVLHKLWNSEPSGDEIESELTSVEQASSGSAAERRNTSDEFRRRFVGPIGLWMKVAEEAVAVQATAYIEWVQEHLRTLAFFILLSLLLTTGLLSSYVFQPQSLVRLLFVFVTIAACASILFVMTEMNRNAVISKINNTKEGVISWDASFISQVALYVVLPLITLLSSEFPALREVVFVWVGPLLKSFTTF